MRVAQLRGAALLEVELLDVLDQPAAILQRYQAALQAGKSAVLCCAVLCCAVLCCAVLCCAVLCRAVPCRAVL